jgi:hypothetical protein
VGEGENTGNLDVLGSGAAQNIQISGILAVPITCLYHRGQTVWSSELLRSRGGNRLGKPWVALNPADAAHLGITDGQSVELEIASYSIGTPKSNAAVCFDESVPAGILLVPRSFGLKVNEPTIVRLNIIPVNTETV